MPLTGFEATTATHEGVTRTVYRRGTGPGVVIIHEVPGITPTVAAFARRVAGAGFTVFMPHLFGVPGKPMTPAYAMAELARCCIRKEFAVLAARKSSPVTQWLRALCRAVHGELGGRGVGALGMCMTGNFALALMVDEAVMAPVLAQPSLPFPIGAERRCGLHLSDSDLSRVKARVANGSVRVLGLRFTADRMVPRQRFARLRSELGTGFEAIEIDSSRGNPHGIPVTAHSVLTHDLVDVEGHPTREALDRVLAFFREQLTGD
jgi:dienelactone hydrolase